MQADGEQHEDDQWHGHKQQLRIADPRHHIRETHHRAATCHSHSNAGEDQARTEGCQNGRQAKTRHEDAVEEPCQTTNGYGHTKRHKQPEQRWSPRHVGSGKVHQYQR